MPVHSGVDFTIVGDMHGDLRALIDVQRRTWNRAVVRQHAQISAVERLADWSDAEIETIAVVEADAA